MLSCPMLRVVATGLALFAAAVMAHAAEIPYPNKPIRLIIPFPPGGSADPLGRALGAWFSEKFGVPVVGDNRPGAGTAIAHTLGAKAVPDGYTLLLGSSSGLTTNPAFGFKLDYDPIKDFAFVGLTAYVPQFLVVHPSVQAKSVNDLIDLAKGQPGKVNFGSPGVGTVGHMSLEWLSIAKGTKFVHVPYKGAAPAVIDLMAGRIQALFARVAGTQVQVGAGKIRAIATGHRERLRAWPDIPAVAEFVPGFSNDGWYGLVAPARTSAAVVSKLNAEMNRALASTEFSKQIQTFGMEPTSRSSSKELREWVVNELARWTKVVREAGIQAQAN